MTATRPLGYRPELDGLRALAVALVLVFHADVGVFRAGYVGVSVFFTLSGYLITRLLLDEHARTGRIDLRRFWTRRARRLLPASAICVVGVVAAARLAWLPTSGLRHDVLAAVLQVFNWSELSGSHTYADLLADRAGPLDHFWSLSIEEQFYWIWPLVIALAGRFGQLRHTVLTLAAAGWVTAPLVASTAGSDAAYWATPARTGEILSGAALAVLAADSSVVARGRDTVLAAAGLATIVVVALSWPTASGPAYGGWFPLFSLATVAVIWGTRDGGVVARGLSGRPLVRVGRISYGLYLYHWPIYLVLDAERLGVDGWALLTARLGATATVAAVSYRLVEQPIRAGAVRLPALSAGLAAAAVAAVVATGTLGTATAARFELPAAPQRGSAAASPPPPEAPAGTTPSVSVATPVTIPLTTPITSPVTTPVTSPVTTEPLVAGPDPDALVLTADQAVERRLMTAARRGPLPLPADDRALRVLVVGDSTAWALADGLFAWSDANSGRIDVTLLAAPGCSWGSGELVDPLAEHYKTACDEYLDDTLERTIADRSPDVVVVMTTFADLEEWIWHEAEGVLVPPSDAFAARLTDDYGAFADRLRAAGAGRIVWVTGPRVMHSAHSDLGGPGDPGRMEMQHDVIDALAAADPDLSVLDLNAWYLASEYGPDDSGRSDRLHLDLPAATDIATRFVVPWLVEIAGLDRSGRSG